MSAPLDGKSLRSPLGRARGLGSAKEGTAHWWAQRVTAVALVPLVLWVVVNALGLAGASLAAAVAWIREVALPHVPDGYRDSFLHRNPVNRALLTAASRHQ